MYKDDPEVKALNQRRVKSLNLKIHLPEGEAPQIEVTEGEHEDEEQDKELIGQVLSEQEAKEAEEGAQAFQKDKDVIEMAAMGGDSKEKVLDDFKTRKPQSLGERVKLDLAKK